MGEIHSPRRDKPSVSIEATAEGLRWKVVCDGETVATGTAQTMQAAKAAAEEIAVRYERTYWRPVNTETHAEAPRPG